MEWIPVVVGAVSSRIGNSQVAFSSYSIFGVGISITASLRMFSFVSLKRFPPFSRGTRHHVNLAARLELQIQSLQASLFSPLPWPDSLHCSYPSAYRALNTPRSTDSSFYVRGQARSHIRSIWSTSCQSHMCYKLQRRRKVAHVVWGKDPRLSSWKQWHHIRASAV
jgi:hypothetical protein